MRIHPSTRVLATTLLAMCASGAQPQTSYERSMPSRTGGASTKATPGADAIKWDFVMKVTGDDGMDAYVDHASIHRAGRVARMVSLWDFKSRQVYEGVKPYLSARNDVEYDCDSMRFRIISARGFADHMGRGSVTGSDGPLPWQAINAGSVFHTQWKTACAPS